MATAKNMYNMLDRRNIGKPADDHNKPLGITDDPAEALKAMDKAKVDGRIVVTEPSGNTRTFVGHNYTALDRKQPGHRHDSRGRDRYHGFIEFCETSGAGSPVTKKKRASALVDGRRKKATAGKRKRAAAKSRQRK